MGTTSGRYLKSYRADKAASYTCPTCGQPVRVKQGRVKPHMVTAKGSKVTCNGSNKIAKE